MSENEEIDPDRDRKVRLTYLECRIEALNNLKNNLISDKIRFPNEANSFEAMATYLNPIIITITEIYKNESKKTNP